MTRASSFAENKLSNPENQAEFYSCLLVSRNKLVYPTTNGKAVTARILHIQDSWYNLI